MSELFLTKQQVAELTGRKVKKLQLEQLMRMHVPFRVNANGAPVVCRSAIESSNNEKMGSNDEWKPRILSERDYGQKANRQP